MEDYYEILEIPRDSTTADIKKAYHQLALKWHPDKNLERKDEAEKMFKVISKAYEILSDENKRTIYDKYGKEGLINDGGNNRTEDFSFFTYREPKDVFREFFGTDLLMDVLLQASRLNNDADVWEIPNLNLRIMKGFFDDLDASNFGTFRNVSGKINMDSIKIINGKRVETKKVIENGIETITVIEDGVVKTKTVNNIPQEICINSMDID